MEAATESHTPGPWGAAYHGPGNTVQHGLAGYSIQGTEGIAYNVCREANARLIAAAPDLLEACRAALVWAAIATARDHEPTHPLAIENAQEDVDKIREAIAKAEGSAD